MKKLLIFLMIAIPLVIILVVNFTVNTVSGFVSVPVDSVSLNKDIVKSIIGEKVTLEATVYPKNASDKEILWTSSNEDVATVDSNGNISFVGFGSGYIIATTNDGNKKASCYFYITDTKVHEIDLFASNGEEKENYYIAIGEDIQLNSIVYPIEAENREIVYTSENPDIATVDANGLVTGVSEGKVKIVVTSTENSLVSNSMIIEVVKPLEKLNVETEEIVISSPNYQISYSVEPIDATITSVKYKSSDENIATVSDYGLVTFTKQGGVAITLTSLQGELTETIYLNYTAGYANDLILKETQINKKIDVGEYLINYSTEPANIDTEVEFTCDDESIVYVDDSGYVQFLKGGNTTIRVRVKKNEEEYIEKTISVFIESPATDIEIEDEYFISTKTLKLKPKSIPNTSTNEKFYYVSKDTNIATVSQDGDVTFIKNESCVAEIEIYANEENSTVKKVVKITYTNGLPSELVLNKENVEIDCGVSFAIDTTIYPTDLMNKGLKYEIVNQTPNSGEGDVVKVNQIGVVEGIAGGTAEIKISCTNYLGEEISKICKVKITKKTGNISFITNLDYYEEYGCYVTSNNTVEFELKNETQDATNKEIIWEVSSDYATKKSEKSIYFNNSGIAEIIYSSKDGGNAGSVKIQYLKNNLISAEVGEISEMKVGEEFEFIVTNKIPSDSTYTPYIKVSKQITFSSTGKVLEVNGNKIKAISGGTAEVTVILANLKFVYNIKTIRKAESLDIEPKNITTTDDKVTLKATVLPEDTTNKDVEYIVEDETIATISDGKLVFKKNGTAKITAKTTDGSNIEYKFSIEKIEKGTEVVKFIGEEIDKKLSIGDSITIVDDEKKYESITFKINSQTPTIAGNDVISLEENVVKALGSGSAEVLCETTDKEGNTSSTKINIEVIILSDEIKFETNLDYDEENKYYVTAKNKIDLKFTVSPETATNKKYKITVSNENIGYIENNQLLFKQAGVVTLEATTMDESGVTESVTIKYTGGSISSATLNITQNQTLNIGEEIALEVIKWVPSDITDKTISITTSSNIVSISGNKITAIAGGKCDITVTISNQMEKTFKITVLNKVTEITLSGSKIITAEKEVVINPTIVPSNATNKVLKYTIDNEEIAKFENKKVIFNKAGTVILKIEATDGSGVSTQVEITSTLGYISSFEINAYEMNIDKNGTANLYMTKYTPSNATNKNIYFEILENTTNNGVDKQVLSISNEGSVVGLYGGTARVGVYTVNCNGEKTYQYCVVNVISKVTSLEITFDKELSTEQGVYVIAESELNCNIKVSPEDASSKNIEISSSNETVAKISLNKILFKDKGVVQITFKAGEISKVYNFDYTRYSLKSIEIDKTGFTNSTLTLNAGEEYKVNIKKHVPIDLDESKIEFTITDKKERKINENTSDVISFENGVIKALNGGTVSFKLNANSIDLGTFYVVVNRACSDIDVEQEIVIGNPEYEINAKALPIDTYQTDLKYELVSGNATLDGKMIKFNEYGKACVNVISIYNEKIVKMITIEYSNEIKKIEFSNTVKSILAGYTYNLGSCLKILPGNATGFTIIYSSDNENLATVDKYSGLVKANSINTGTVNITATVEGKNITATVAFEISSGISDIALELNSINDSLGIGGYKIWGTSFCVDENGETLVNTYQMNIIHTTPGGNEGNVIWKSSDTSLATVDENGLVTFLGKSGKVKISVEAKPEFALKASTPARAIYEFTLVNGVNVTNYTQLRKFVDGKYNVVLQSDIKAPAENGVLNLQANLYGNGHLLDFANTESYYEKIIINTDNILVDNVRVRAANFSNGGALSSLQDVGKCLQINSHDGKKTVGVVIRNSTFENAYICTEVCDSEALFEGCIIKNALSTCIQVSASDFTKIPPIVTLQDCILSRALLSAIVYNFKEVDENGKIRLYDGYYPKVILKENVKIYNWVNFSEYNIDFIKRYTGEFVSDDALTNALVSAVSNQAPGIISEKANGDKCIFLGTVAFSYNIVNRMQKKADGILEQNGNEIKLDKKSIKMEIQGIVSASMDFYTLNNLNDIKPDETFIENAELYKGIRHEFEE